MEQKATVGHASDGLDLDYVIVFAQKDKNEAIKIRNRLRELGYCGELYDNGKFDFTDPVKAPSELINRSAAVLFCVSNNIASSDNTYDTMFGAFTFIMGKLPRLKEKKLVIPVYLENRQYISDATRQRMSELMSIDGLEFESKCFYEDIQKRLQSRSARNLEQQQAYEGTQATSKPESDEDKTKQPRDEATNVTSLTPLAKQLNQLEEHLRR